MPDTLHLTDTTTGETRVVAALESWAEDEYLWVDGNFACDCNRADAFARAGGEPEPAPEDSPCGSTRYVLRVTDAAGRTIYDEAPDA